MPIDSVQGEALLETVKSKFGFIPNVLKEMAKNPAILKVYLEGNEALASSSLLTEPERQVVMLTVSRVNGCPYCQAVHKALSKKAGVAAEVIDAVVQDSLPAAPWERALVTATRLLMEKRGWLEASDMEDLGKQGLTRPLLYELTGIIAIKTISNYINHMAHTELDPQFKG